MAKRTYRMSRSGALVDVSEPEHAPDTFYQHETHVGGGFGNQPEGSSTMRIFMGRAKYCRCAPCTKRRDDETIAHMVARGLLAE